MPFSSGMEDYFSGLHFENFSNHMQLKEVIVGAYSQVTRKQLNDVLGPDRQNIKSFKARAAYQTYTVTENLLKRDWK